MRYVLVSGGVISGVGKGIIASSTGLLLKTRGLRVSCIKIDPYVSFDAGLMSPAEHGECFVLGSGDEVDLDLGNYERYLSLSLTGDNNVTTGKIYHQVIQKERRGDYLGKTVQIVPHITDALKAWFRRVASTCVDGSGEEPDVCIIELGGTVGDIESLPFIEALSQLRHEAGPKNFLTIHVTYVPIVHGETKTKPTQHAVKAVRSYGLIPDVVACRCEQPLPASTVDKLALHCQVEINQILVVRDMPTIYQVPILLRDQKLLELLDERLDIKRINVSAASQQQGAQLWQKWTSIVTREFVAELNVVLVGKYVETPDAYLSVVKSLEHSSMRIRRKLNLVWIDAEHLEPKTRIQEQEKYDKAWQAVHDASGIIVPGGFGRRGTEGMMLVSQWAREHKRPFLGVCLGFQIAVIQFARDFCGMVDADSTEFDPETSQPVVISMPELNREKMGGTMRLGSRVTLFQDGTSEKSKIRKLYGGSKEIHERHRHRYEVNPEAVDKLESAGLRFVGKDDTGKRMEVFELDGHPYFVGTQFHAEYQSRVLDPSRPYLGFIAASAGCLDQVINETLPQARQGVAVANEVNGVNGSNGTTHF